MPSTATVSGNGWASSEEAVVAPPVALNSHHRLSGSHRKLAMQKKRTAGVMAQSCCEWIRRSTATGRSMSLVLQAQQQRNRGFAVGLLAIFRHFGLVLDGDGELHRQITNDIGLD